MNASFNNSPHHWLHRLCLCSLVLFIGVANAQATEHESHDCDKKEYAPRSLAGMDVSFQIENAVSSLPNGFPTQGAVVRHYQDDGSWTEEGTGGPFHQPAHGTFQYQRTGALAAVERSIDQSMNNAPATTNYTFDGPMTGKWVTNWGNGLITFSGRFTLAPRNLPASQQLAPASIAGLHVALHIRSGVSISLPAGAFPTIGLVVQSYAADGTVNLLGFGRGTLNSHGTYTYKKISSNTAVEEVMQTSELFTLPYTMVYTFQTPTSGVWFQNLGNGLIRFSGTFDTFAR